MDRWFAPALSGMDTEFSDCRILVGSKIFKCHKLILACASDVFKRMMLIECKESISGDIFLDDVTPETFEIFRQYIYSYNTVKLNEHDNATLMDLYLFGNKFLVPSISNDCLKLLIDRTRAMKDEELVEIFEFAFNLDDKTLFQTVTTCLNRSNQKINNRVFLLGSDIFKEYMATVAKNERVLSKFRAIEKYLEINGFLDYINLKEEPHDANNKTNLNDKNATEDCHKIVLKQSNPMDNDSNEDASQKENKSDFNEANVENENKMLKNKIDPKPKAEFIKSLLESIDYSKMTGYDFYQGPGKSSLFTYQFKFETLNNIFKKSNSEYVRGCRNGY
ncbi:PREDICTED: kelch-like protein 40b [Drosophila arizonae]|uniref:Kelch-like protein 40b n=1 Tax=Drosophila arizonae TaxID=7263 RepID=A0ABM1P0M8_DROAR|nr:PREDICTED: kelch-like protein 40b [Drosophila arizonae]